MDYMVRVRRSRVASVGTQGQSLRATHGRRRTDHEESDEEQRQIKGEEVEQAHCDGEADSAPVADVPEVQVTEIDATVPQPEATPEEAMPTKGRRSARVATSGAKSKPTAPKPLSCLDAA